MASGHRTVLADWPTLKGQHATLQAGDHDSAFSRVLDVHPQLEAASAQSRLIQFDQSKFSTFHFVRQIHRKTNTPFDNTRSGSQVCAQQTLGQTENRLPAPSVANSLPPPTTGFRRINVWFCQFRKKNYLINFLSLPYKVDFSAAFPKFARNKS